MTPAAYHHDAASFDVAWVFAFVLLLGALALTWLYFRANRDINDLDDQLATMTGDLAHARHRVSQLEQGLNGCETELAKWKQLCWEKEDAVRAAHQRCDALERRLRQPSQQDLSDLANRRPPRTQPREERAFLNADERRALREIERHLGDTADGAA